LIVVSLIFFVAVIIILGQHSEKKREAQSKRVKQPNTRSVTRRQTTVVGNRSNRTSDGRSKLPNVHTDTLRTTGERVHGNDEPPESEDDLRRSWESWLG